MLIDLLTVTRLTKEMVNTLDLFLTKDEAGDIVGIPPDELNALQEISQAIGNYSSFSSN